MQDWNDYRGALQKRVAEYAELNPEAFKGVRMVSGSVVKQGHLDAKTHELIALAVAVTTRCDGCIAVHAKMAVEAGATREEIAEALTTAIAMNTGAALTYTARVMDAVDSLPTA